ncbi:DUF885 domain-containing protein [Croceicoccus ponticola]|uniref:DUF885 domain-containing protein n=2 Tax=Croceicoccus ponticola TaxID=2217664 RepID=A0A437GYX7_9SPHN|nr:DUF885 domain-containing protein [Croceicoccus ponticola]
MLAGASTLMLSACAMEAERPATPTSTATVADKVRSQAMAAFFDAYDKAELARSPEGKSYRGIRDGDYGKWDDYTEAAEAANYAADQQAAAAMRATFDPATLSAQDRLSYALFDYSAQQSARMHRFRDHGYPFNQMSGMQSAPAAFLINIHSIEDAAQAEAYIDRIAGIGPMLTTIIARSSVDADKGLMPPKWVYDRVLSDIDNQIEPVGPDFAGNAIIDDFAEKIAKIELDDATRADMMARARAAWGTSARPAYLTLRKEMVRQKAMAGTDDGVWHLPEGDVYYDGLLNRYTTTDLTADQIHDLGVRNVTRIHDEMRTIMKQVGFTGTLQEFFEYTRTDPRFYYTTRESYLDEVQQHLTAMEAALPQYFGTLPADPLKVKAVEPFREATAGKAFYQSPAPDGSRPGTYYVNLFRLDAMSKNELEALVYHEGLPGHHLQLSIQTGLDELPAFRRFGGYTAYSEGWGLYAEELAKDMGFYKDPYHDFGRLQMELWRACRLVVDTGIHRKRWTREQAIQYLMENTPNPQSDVTKAIERYIVYPGQATSYMIGKLKIMELRERARTELGAEFDIRAFHDVVLENGPLPLAVLESNVDAWIAAHKR